MIAVLTACIAVGAALAVEVAEAGSRSTSLAPLRQG
jgi:hypothetical protein